MRMYLHNDVAWRYVFVMLDGKPILVHDNGHITKLTGLYDQATVDFYAQRGAWRELHFFSKDCKRYMFVRWALVKMKETK